LWGQANDPPIHHQTVPPLDKENQATNGVLGEPRQGGLALSEVRSWGFEESEYDEEEDYDIYPEVCSNGGWYAPGTEQCDFCPWADVCSEVRFQ